MSQEVEISAFSRTGTLFEYKQKISNTQYDLDIQEGKSELLRSNYLHRSTAVIDEVARHPDLPHRTHSPARLSGRLFS